VLQIGSPDGALPLAIAEFLLEPCCATPTEANDKLNIFGFSRTFERAIIAAILTKANTLTPDIPLAEANGNELLLIVIFLLFF
jgi:hypothetical protein